MRLEVEQNAKAGIGNLRLDEGFDIAMKTMEKNKPLIELLSPLWQKLEQGLLGMTRVVGSSTKPKDIDPGLLAATLDVRQRCENDVMVHMKQIKRVAETRLVELKKIQKGQMAQVQSLKESIRTLKSRLKASAEQMKEIDNKSMKLAQRCDMVLQTAKDLRPSITRGDLQFFDLLKRTKAQCTDWELLDAALLERGDKVLEKIDEEGTTRDVRLTQEESGQCKVLLGGQSEMLQECEDRIESTQATLRELMSSAVIATEQPSTRDRGQ